MYNGGLSIGGDILSNISDAMSKINSTDTINNVFGVYNEDRKV